MDAPHPTRLGGLGLEMVEMSEVAITLGGSSRVVDRAVAEGKIVHAEAAISYLRECRAECRAQHRANHIISDADQSEADARTESAIAHYESIIAACRAALGA